MKIKFSQSMPSIKLEDIVKFESQSNIKLPKQYQDFLLKYNGGIPDMGAFDYYDSHVERLRGNHITRFLGLSDTDENATIQRIIQYVGGRLSKDVLPIAQTSTGDLVCIKIVGNQIGQIYLWKQSYEIIIQIANDFDHFIDTLHFPPELEDD